jgi:hypothetical protein
MEGRTRTDVARHSFIPVFQTIALYVSLVLIFTVISIYSSPQASETGTFRALSAIPPHVLALVAGGTVLGLLAFAIFRRLDLVLLIPSVVVLTDLDHLPSALGIAQPIRPAHSIVFIVTAFVLVATIIRRLDLSFAVMSGFFIHLSIDTGQFPPFSPLSFNYYTLGNYQTVFVGLALASGLLAGYLGKRMSSKK